MFSVSNVVVVVVCRNQTKYTQGKNSELRAILEKAKKRSEKKRAANEEQVTAVSYTNSKK